MIDRAGFEVLEEAALMMIGHHETADLDFYRSSLQQCLAARGVEPEEAARLADRFATIIERRRAEIVLAAGGNITGVAQ